MASSSKRNPAPMGRHGARGIDQLASQIVPEDSLSLPQIQALHLVRHFRLPMPIAETIARLAFTESRR
jgi:hypothetical protein